MNRERIVDEIVTLVTEVEEGNEDALKALIHLKGIEKILADSISQIKEAAVTEAKKYEAKEFELEGAKVQVKEGAARFSYKHIPQWNTLDDKRKLIEEAAKNRYKNPSLLVADESGEEIPMAKCTYDKESIAITLKNY